MARRPSVTTTIGDKDRRPLRFDVQDKALELRNRQFGAARRASINVRGTEVGSGEGLGLDVGLVLTEEEAAAIGSSKKLTRELNKIVNNAGARLLRRVQEVSRATYDTGLFYSAWRVRTVKNGDAKFRIELQNSAPYALYVHRAGTPRDKTVVNTYIKPLIQQSIDEVLEDLTGVSGVLSKALAGVILRPLAKVI